MKTMVTRSRYQERRLGVGTQRWPRWSVVLALIGLVSLRPGSAAAQEAVPTDRPTIIVSGIGHARSTAETATIQILVGNSEGVYGPIFPSAIVPADAAVPGASTPEAGETTVGSEASGAEVVPAVGPMGPPSLTAEDLRPLIQAMVEAGVKEEDVRSVTGPAASGIYGPGGPGAAFVEAEVARPTQEGVGEIVDAVTKAATDNGLLVQQLGVGYDIADCAPLEREARQAAVEDARAQAEQLAELVEVTLGDLVQVSSFPTYGSPFPAEDDGGCPPSPEVTMIGPGGMITTPPFDPRAEAEAEVYAQVTMTFAIANAEGTPTS